MRDPCCHLMEPLNHESPITSQLKGRVASLWKFQPKLKMLSNETVKNVERRKRELLCFLAWLVSLYKFCTL